MYSCQRVCVVVLRYFPLALNLPIAESSAFSLCGLKGGPGCLGTPEIPRAWLHLRNRLRTGQVNRSWSRALSTFTVLDGGNARTKSSIGVDNACGPASIEETASVCGDGAAVAEATAWSCTCRGRNALMLSAFRGRLKACKTAVSC